MKKHWRSRQFIYKYKIDSTSKLNKLSKSSRNHHLSTSFFLVSWTHTFLSNLTWGNKLITRITKIHIQSCHGNAPLAHPNTSDEVPEEKELAVKRGIVSWYKPASTSPREPGGISGWAPPSISRKAPSSTWCWAPAKIYQGVNINLSQYLRWRTLHEGQIHSVAWALDGRTREERSCTGCPSQWCRLRGV